MGYCRFQNTVSDLDDCYEHLSDELGEEESEARDHLVRLCKKIVEDME